MFSLFLKKIVPCLLIVALLLPSAYLFYRPKKVEAAATCLAQISAVLLKNKILGAIFKPVPTSNNTVEIATGGSFVTDCILKPLAIQLARAMLYNMTVSIVNWINNGFHGNPFYAKNLKNLLNDTTDQVIGQFLERDLGAGFLCAPFALQVRVTLAQTYLPDRQRSACTLSQINRNVNGFVEGNNMGGWENWLQVTTIPQNNVYGATVLAQDALSKAIAEKVGIQNKNLDWGRGLRGTTICKYTYAGPYDESNPKNNRFVPAPANMKPNDPECAETEDTTPGAAVEGMLVNSLGSDMRRLEVANDINAIVGALTNQLMAQVVNGAKGLLGAGKTSGSNGGAVYGSVTYDAALNNTTADTALDTAINNGLNQATAQTDELFTVPDEIDAGGGTGTTGTPTPDDETTTPEEPTLELVVDNKTDTVTMTAPLDYEIRVKSNRPVTGMKAFISLKKGNNLVPFRQVLNQPRIIYGAAGTGVVIDIVSTTDATQPWRNVFADKTTDYVFKLSGERNPATIAGNYTVEFILTDGSNTELATSTTSFVVQ